MNKLIGRLCSLVLLIAIVSPNVLSAADAGIATVQRAIYVSLLLDSSQRDSRFGATAIRRFSSTDMELMDLVAEKLARTIETTVDVQSIRTIKAYVDTLASDHSGRYRALLRSTRAKVKDSGVIRRIDDALSSNNNSGGTAFVPGLVNLDQQRSAAVQILHSDIRADRALFRSITSGTALEEVIRRIGMPDHIHARGMHVQLLEFSYDNLGVVVLTGTISSNKSWSVSYAARELVPVNMLYKGDNIVVAQNLASLEGRTLAYYFKSENKRIYRDASAMCLLARRVAGNSRHEDPYEENLAGKALAHIAVSTDPCAEDTLKFASTHASEKLATLARKLMEKRAKLVTENQLKNLQTGSTVKQADEDGDDSEDDDNDEGSSPD